MISISFVDFTNLWIFYHVWLFDQTDRKFYKSTKQVYKSTIFRKKLIFLKKKFLTNKFKKQIFL